MLLFILLEKEENDKKGDDHRARKRFLPMVIFLEGRIVLEKQREKKYYTTGTFAKMASVTVRTIRYYDKQNILKPSHMSESGYRLYTDEDFVKLQRILVLKYLGFSLEEIRTMPLQSGVSDMAESFQMQLKLIRQKKEHLEQIEQALCEAQQLLHEKNRVDWEEILHLIHITNLEKSLLEQYQTATNLEIRIELHRKYSTNKKGWFPWLYEQLPLNKVDNILEIGCGSGELWFRGLQETLKNKHIVLSDLSKGMIAEARENLKNNSSFDYVVMDGQQLLFPDEYFNLVIANHVMFYMKDIKQAVKEVARVLQENGIFICSTYGKNHMREITEMVQEFDKRIRLSEVNLYEQFGIENGRGYLEEQFQEVEFCRYEDSLVVDEAEPIVNYVLSCHGNQRELLDGRTEQFKQFIEDKIKRTGFVTITKEAGIFRCRKTFGNKK